MSEFRESGASEDDGDAGFIGGGGPAAELGSETDDEELDRHGDRLARDPAAIEEDQAED